MQWEGIEAIQKIKNCVDTKNFEVIDSQNEIKDKYALPNMPTHNV